MRVIVAGAGIAGLAAALAAARRGQQVTLVERDPLPPAEDPSAAGASRSGVPQFHLPQVLLPRGRQVLLEHFPDVYRALMRVGAEEIDLVRKVFGECLPDDDRLVYLGVRRPVLEWALHQAVSREPNIRFIAPVRIRGFLGTAGPVPRIQGLLTATGQRIEGDVVLNAMGRMSPVAGWIEALGGSPPIVESLPVGFLYYGRNFQLRPGVEFPDGPWLTGPSGAVGNAKFLAWPGDNGTFGICFFVPAGDRHLRNLRHEADFMAACRESTELRMIVADHMAEPITGVIPLGMQQHSFWEYRPGGNPCARGILPAGDAICHMDSQFSYGLSFSLVHAVEFGAALAESAGDVPALTENYHARIEPEVRERFAMVRDVITALDQLDAGAKLDSSKRTGCFPLFAFRALNLASVYDPELLRVAIRRFGLLDRVSVFDNDIALQERVEALCAQIQEETAEASAIAA